MSEHMPLTYYIDYFPGYPGFVELVFGKDDQIYQQVIDADGYVCGFEAVDVEESISLLTVSSVEVATVGQQAWCGFRNKDDTVVIKQWQDMRAYLTQAVEHYTDMTFLSYEIYEFLHNDDKLAACADLIMQKQELFDVSSWLGREYRTSSKWGKRIAAAAPQTTQFKIDKQLYFPHCVMLVLDARRDSKETISLYGEICFSPAWHTFVKPTYVFFTEEWRVKFAIQSGALVFSLKGVTAPLRAREFIHNMQVNLKSKEKPIIAKDSASLNVPTSPKAVLSDEHSPESSQELSTTHEEKTAVSEDDSEVSVITVHTTGEESTPIWTLQSKRVGGYLSGLFNYKLAELYPSNGEIVIRAEFKTAQRAISIQEIDSIKYAQMSHRKKLMVKATLRKWLYEEILKKKCLASCTIYEAPL